MTSDSSPFASAEIASFWRFLIQVPDKFGKIMDGLSPEELNWHPDAPGTNSIHVLATHTMGNLRWTILEIIGGQPINRDRDGEFRSVATESNVPIETWPSVRAELDQVIAGLPADAMDHIYHHPVFGDLTGRDVLHVMIGHAAEHLGHAGMTRDLVLAARMGDAGKQVARWRQKPIDPGIHRSSGRAGSPIRERITMQYNTPAYGRGVAGLSVLMPE